MFAELGDKMYLVNVCVRVGAEAHVRTRVNIDEFHDNVKRKCRQFVISTTVII